LEHHIARGTEQREVLQEITTIADAECADVILIAGDIFDVFSPSVESSELFYATCKQLTRNGTRPVIAIAGNHDSPERIEMPDALARTCGILFAGFPDTVVLPVETEGGIRVVESSEGFVELRLPSYSYSLKLFLTPYANEYRLRRYLRVNDDDELRDLLQSHWQSRFDRFRGDPKQSIYVLMAHLFFTRTGGNALEEADDEKPILHLGGASAMFPEQIPEGLQYVALGHLHRAHTVSTTPCPIVYSGSPLAYSFNEENQQKYVYIVDIEPNMPAKYRKVSLQSGRRMIRARFDDIPTAVDWLQNNPNIWVQLTIVADKYLDAASKKLLYDAHDGIVMLCPELRSDSPLTADDLAVNQPKTIQRVFIDYFKSKHKGVTPSDELLDLFAEILGEGEEESL
jgi:DNA repair protein SbcD/Mre11